MRMGTPLVRRRAARENTTTVGHERSEGGFFLLQPVDLGGNKGLEVIGHEHRYGEDPSADIRSRYDGFSEGETLDYTYEIKDDTLTIWMGDTNGRPDSQLLPAQPRAHALRTNRGVDPCWPGGP